jgi:hypothetical protein
VEKRLKNLAEREKAAKRSAAQLVRIQGWSSLHFSGLTAAAQACFSLWLCWLVGWCAACCAAAAAAAAVNTNDTQGRVQAVCGQLQSDIARMKAARAAVQRRMEAKEKEFR